MGTFKKGILGGFPGKGGTVVGSNWRVLDVMRSLPKKSGLNLTPEHVAQRQKFVLVVGFLNPNNSSMKIDWNQKFHEKEFYIANAE